MLWYTVPMGFLSPENDNNNNNNKEIKSECVNEWVRIVKREKQKELKKIKKIPSS